jgi:serine/threonine-protein kinase RsbW
VSERREITLPNRIESVEEAASEVEKFARENGVGDDILVGVDMAVREAMANAVKHGNAMDETKSVEIAMEKAPEVLTVTVRDFGEGFDSEDLPDPTEAANLLKASGRGILFMRTFMDEVQWSPAEGGGTTVKMLKKL